MKTNTCVSTNLNQTTFELPKTGLKRAAGILPCLPIKRSTLWAWSKDGRFPAPIRIGSITCWRCEDVWEWLNAQGVTMPEAANDVEGE